MICVQEEFTEAIKHGKDSKGVVNFINSLIGYITQMYVALPNLDNSAAAVCSELGNKSWTHRLPLLVSS